MYLEDRASKIKKIEDKLKEMADKEKQQEQEQEEKQLKPLKNYVDNTMGEEAANPKAATFWAAKSKDLKSSGGAGDS